MVQTSVGTSPSSMGATTVILDIEFWYIIISCSTLYLGWQRRVCPDYEVPGVGDSNENLQQILSAVILRIHLRDAVYMTLFLVADYFNVKVLTGIWVLNRHVYFIWCIDQQVERTKGVVLPIESTMNFPTKKWLQSVEDDYSGPTTNAATKKWTFILTSCVKRSPGVNTSAYSAIYKFGLGQYVYLASYVQNCKTKVATQKNGYGPGVKLQQTVLEPRRHFLG